ncbi:GNAT family N-acetyltransferase [Streptococcus anginosus]|uniref:GNAT family N-acetyltransferase n=1 Tax=Streptococcus anginosus TaxID=1328 RepID=A0ABD4U3E5_STRAP|nr:MULTISPECIES: GNAT family N-acetyltransferase [Streptococcus]KAA9295229.1 GNAT family N-acetyltransferase [Streptococcus anginosus]KUM00442.1 GNAT family acetyltransferase [Streptococcus anginosus]MCW1076627.1 GNAT family N-acetyltransferase [Streptococcus anginosus]MDB8655299.1 GNAT family N-acetyltransferase [Streptococcus anginosus]MDB8658808.1 GNAT family N-acetyltransferase [Streptococcus anginosus]
MIRSAELSDAAAIQEINAIALGYDFGLIETRQKLSELLDRSDHFILVAENAAGQIVGYAHAASYDCLYFPSLLNLLALAVAPDFQGQGYGKALMQAIREEGVAAGYTGIRINSGISRMKAHEFYRKLGCEEKADQKRFYWEF